MFVLCFFERTTDYDVLNILLKICYKPFLKQSALNAANVYYIFKVEKILLGDLETKSQMTLQKTNKIFYFFSKHGSVDAVYLKVPLSAV